jgi:hypothetical protein
MFEAIPHQDAPLVLDIALLTAREKTRGQDLFLASLDAELARCWRSANETSSRNILDDAARSASFEARGNGQAKGDRLLFYFAAVKVPCMEITAISTCSLRMSCV